MTLQSSGEIKFSQIRSEFGASGEVKASQFYRNGSAGVDSTRTVTIHGAFDATNSSPTGGVTASVSTNNGGTSFCSSSGNCVRYISFGDNYNGIVVDFNSNTSYGSINTNIGSVHARGPAWDSGDSSNSNIYNAPFKSSGQNIAITWRGGGVSQGSGTGRAQANANTYNISFTNSNGYTVNLNGNSTGGSRSLGSGSSATVQSSGGGSSYRIAANANTTTTNINQGVPTSGQLKFSHFYGAENA